MKPSLPILLSVNGGYVDAAGYLALHGLFKGGLADLRSRARDWIRPIRQRRRLGGAAHRLDYNVRTIIMSDQQ